ncbi:MAG TPA: tRNA preQ1(34) S-adenosylmethionine ribosyltransferase-isomerase QueA [Thermoanaerobaculia bacterium]|nr:tRNA preQ1(34) S-adenosylmethionine ribosyltransferase-isomerase QueA [Thermoanaerobaculia bacterium]
MRTADFDFELPAAAIAQQAAARGESRLFVLDAPGEARHRTIRDLPSLLAPGDLLVVNDTRVIPARLFARRPDTGGLLELLLVERRGPREWLCLARPGRRARTGRVFRLEGPTGGSDLSVEVVGRGEEGRFEVRFSEPIEPWLEILGHVPLPPYIQRADTAADRERYQTVYARQPGSIAAPTAGLHFTPELLGELESAGIARAAVTLHVGLGTFLPVTAEEVADHRMEAERWEIPEATATAIAACRERGGRVVAVGTTVVRTLESAALAAEPGRAGTGACPYLAGSGSTRLFITPGFPFQVVDALLTNFHLPRSTLLMLVSAFAGRERVLAAYREAIAAGYRFYSYGDAMLVRRGS